MENKEYSEIVGSDEAPFMNELADRSTTLTQMFAIRHPSLPNYLALIGGSTFGIHNDCTDCFVDSPNLVDQLETHGISWKAYMEGMPSACYKGSESGRYAMKHNPFMYFENIRNSPERCNKVVPFTELERDLANDSMPQFAFITPDLCNDTHDCPISTGDDFLATWVPKITEHLDPSGILIVTYDEGSSHERCCGLAAGGHIYTVITGPGARSGERISEPVSIYSILRLIEDNWGLGHLGAAGDESTPSIVGFKR
jgi:hypothetical protein